MVLSTAFVCPGSGVKSAIVAHLVEYVTMIWRQAEEERNCKEQRERGTGREQGRVETALGFDVQAEQSTLPVSSVSCGCICSTGTAGYSRGHPGSSMWVCIGYIGTGPGLVGFICHAFPSETKGHVAQLHAQSSTFLVLSRSRARVVTID